MSIGLLTARFRWIFLVIIIAGLGFLLLRSIGGLFISEITREISLEGPAVENASIGKPAPYFELPDLSRSDLASELVRSDLNSFLGKPLVLTFWTTWNEKAADQIRILDGHVAKRGEDLFKIIAVSSQEDQSAVSNFMTRGGYRVRVLLDEKGSVTEQYRARNLPMTFFIDKDGIIQDAFVGVMSEEMLLNKVEMILK